MASPGTLEQPTVRIDLIRELAGGVHSHGELGDRFGVTRQAVSLFAQRHADRIAEVRRSFDDAMAGITYSSKQARVEMLSDLIADNVKILRDPAQLTKLSVSRAELTRSTVSCSREIGDLLGQFPAKVQGMTEAPLQVSINGIDMDLLR